MTRPWMPAGLKPPRPGVYERRLRGDDSTIETLSCDGKQWFKDCGDGTVVLMALRPLKQIEWRYVSPLLTDWFPPDVQPVRHGVYETEEPDGSRFYNLFDNHGWHYGISDCQMPVFHPDPLPARLLKRWRGLAEEPTA